MIFSALWKSIFAREQLSFNSPAVKRYIKNNTVRCGADFVGVDNAWYCKEDDTIWYDPIFLARMKDVQKSLAAARGRARQTGAPQVVWLNFPIDAYENSHRISRRVA